MVEQMPPPSRLRRRRARAGRHADHERSVPERRPPQRHQPDRPRPRRRRAARLRRQPRPPRRRRRRRAGQHRRLPRSLPGGRDHPAGQAGRRRPDRPDLFASCSPRYRSKHETAGDLRAQIAANTTGVRRLQALVARHGRRRRSPPGCASCSTTPNDAPAPSSPACPTAAIEAEGLDRHRRLQRRAGRCCARGSTLGPDGASFDTTRLATSAARPGQLDLRADVLGLRLHAQVPDRPGPARQRRLLPPAPRAARRPAPSPTAAWPSPSSAAGRPRRGSST